jgi:hypothetical protein
MYFEATTDGVHDPMKGVSSLSQGIPSQRGSIDIYDIESNIFHLAEKRMPVHKGLIPSSEERFSFSVKAAVFKFPNGMIA